MTGSGLVRPGQLQRRDGKGFLPSVRRKKAGHAPLRVLVAAFQPRFNAPPPGRGHRHIRFGRRKKTGEAWLSDAFRTRRELVQTTRNERRILLPAHQITARLNRFKSKVTTSIASHTASGEKSTGSVRSLGK